MPTNVRNVKNSTYEQDMRKHRLNTNGVMKTTKFFLSVGRFPRRSIMAFGRTCENNQRRKVYKKQ